jgi:hypothetical protein
MAFSQQAMCKWSASASSKPGRALPGAADKHRRMAQAPNGRHHVDADDHRRSSRMRDPHERPFEFVEIDTPPS